MAVKKFGEVLNSEGLVIFTVNMCMLTLVETRDRNPGWDAVIAGPQGTLLLTDLVWITDRQDLLEIYYWEAWAVTQGAYHCCFSIPGKVTLLPA